MFKTFVGISISLLIAGGCAAPFPVVSARDSVPESPSAEAILSASIDAHGLDLSELSGTVSVAYDGEFYRAVKFLQPEIVDAGFRKRSDEIVDLVNLRIEQVHEGNKGAKRVVRDPGDVSVFYNGEPNEDQVKDAAAALVADVYIMFITGPSYFKARGADMEQLIPVTEEGRTYYRLTTTLAPGFGFSEADQVVLWIDSDTYVLKRLHFTLEGFASTQGAHVDVLMSDHRWINGHLWPTTFLERVRGPLRVKAHSWRVTDLNLAFDQVAPAAPLTGI
jgi:hypothetical protein